MNSKVLERGVFMKIRYSFGLSAFIVGYLVACSPVKFDKNENSTSVSCNGFSVGCTQAGAYNVFDYSLSVSGGKVDILFVDDNSASMSFEQQNMASRLANFINTLDTQSVDYRIGIITTDVSTSAAGSAFSNDARSINQNGALQDGRLIQFGNGQYYLTPTTTNRQTLFANAIKRQETSTCETYLQSNSSAGQTSSTYLANCPSPDERGTYAINLFLKNNPSGFIRSDSTHIAVVVLSDEDIRSSVYTSVPSFSLTTDDLPTTVVSNATSLYGSKTFKVHSMIIKPGTLNGYTAQEAAQKIQESIRSDGSYDQAHLPSGMFTGGDSTCLNTQNSQINGVSGSYGYIYSILTQMTGGIEGDVCAADYSSQLSSIANNIGQQVNQIQVACDNPSSLTINFTAGAPVGFSVSGRTVQFNSTLNVGTNIRIQYQCPH